MKKLVLGFVFLFAILLLKTDSELSAQQESGIAGTASNSPWEDERVKEWNAFIQNGKKQEAIAKIERDLQSDSPHFLATNYWYETNRILDTLDERLESLNGTVAGKRLEVPVEIFLAFDDGDRYAIAKKYPDASATDDPMALRHLYLCSSNPESDLSYLVRALQLQPHFFVAAWELATLPQNQYGVLERVATECRTGSLKDGPYARFILDELKNIPRMAGIDRLQAAKQLLQGGNVSPYLLRFQGHSLFELGRFHEAFESFRQASEMSPFSPSNVSAAKCLIRQEKFLEAREFTAHWAQVSSADPEQAAAKTEQSLARAMRLAGEHGRARDILKPHPLLNQQAWWRIADRETVRPLEVPGGALAKWPDNVELNEEMARLELADGRDKEAAVYARVAYAGKPDSQTLCELLLETLRKSGEVDKWFEVWEQADEKFENLTKDLFYEAIVFLRDDELDAALEVSEKATIAFPHSAWIISSHARNLELAEEMLQSVETFRMALEIDPNYEYGINSLWRTMGILPEDQGGGDLAAETEMREHLDNRPWIKRHWVLLASRLKTDDEKCELWNKAVRLNPNQSWPWDMCLGVYFKAKDWDAASDYLESIRSVANNKSISYQALVEWNQAYLLNQKSLEIQLTADEFEMVFKACDEMDIIGTPVLYRSWTSERFRTKLFLDAGEKQKSAESVRRFSKALPDITYGWHGAFNRNQSRDVGLKALFTIGFRYIERSPFDGERIGNVAERHLQWGGSPLIANFLYELMSKIASDHYEESEIQERHTKALSRFGASKNHFEIAYKNDKSVSNSERYISWYDSSRRKAQLPDNEVVFENGDIPRVTMTRPDGRVETRGYDPVSGRIIEWKIGAAWVKCEFGGGSKDGLTRIESSSGQWVDLIYRGEQISQINSSSGTEMKFAYNENNQPNLIELVGMGRLKPIYADDGEVLRTDLENETDQTDHEISLVVTTEFQRLLRLNHLFDNLGKGELPDLPMDETELDLLRKDVEAKGDQEVVSIVSFATSRDATLLALGLSDGQIALYRNNDEKTKVWQVDLGEVPVMAIDFDSTAKNLVVAGGNFEINVLNAGNGELIYSFEQHPEIARAARFVSDKVIASGDDAGFVVLNNWKEDKIVFSSRHHGDWIRAIEVSPDGKLFASGSDDGTVAVFKTVDGTLVSAAKAAEDSSYVHALAFLDNDTAVYEQNGVLKFWNYSDGGVKSVELNAEGSVYSIFMDYQNKQVICGTANGEVCHINFSGTIVKKWQPELGAIRNIGVMEDSKFLALTADGGDQLVYFPMGSEEATKVLSAAMEVAFTQEDYFRARLTLAAYLVEHISDRQTHGAEAREILDQLVTLPVTTGNEDEDWLQSLVIAATDLHYQLMQKTRLAGLPTSEFVIFSDAIDKLNLVSHSESLNSKKAKQVFEKIEQDGLGLLKSSQWMARSDFAVPGFWQRYDHHQVMPDKLVDQGARIQCVFIRENGDLLVGTTHGLSVLRKGFWEWFGVNEKRARLSANVEYDELTAQSSILSIAETLVDGRQVLWLGTAGGLVRIEGDYASDSRVKRWTSESDGLLSPRIEHLVGLDSDLFIGTTEGGFLLSEDTIAPIDELSGKPIRWAKMAITTDGAGFAPISSIAEKNEKGNVPNPILVGTDNDLFGVSNSQVVFRLDQGQLEDAVWSIDESTFFFLQKGIVKAIGFDGRQFNGNPRVVAGQGSIVKSQTVNGLSQIRIDDTHSGIAVLTDMGAGVYFDRHFEHLNTPKLLSTQTASFVSMAVQGRRLAIWSSQGIYTFDRQRVLGDQLGHALSIAVSEQQGLTFVARGDHLEFYENSNIEAGSTLVQPGGVWMTATDKQGRLYYNMGDGIFRIDSIDEAPMLLFFARQEAIEIELTAESPDRMTISSDGTVWVSSGASLFRWKDGMEEAEEYSYYHDPEKFPSRTELLSHVIEIEEGRILIVCSDEGHLVKDGIDLKGGLLEWDGENFERLEMNDEFKHWFLTSYTQVSETTGIAGTTHGFSRRSNGKFTSYEDRKDVSYDRLGQETPRLFLGTPGAKLGEDVWLFGTAGGVVGWNAGQWFNPERLNWLLPNDSMSDYGSRHVHDIGTTSQGHIFIGTDQGLLIYNSGGGSADFLMFNNRLEHAVNSAQQKQIDEQRRVLIDGYLEQNPDSDFAIKFHEYEKVDKQLSIVNSYLGPGEELLGSAESAIRSDRAGQQATSRISQLEQERERLSIEHLRMMQELTREYPAAIQLLQVKPLDVRSVRQNLAEGEAVLQYILTDQKLYIHLVRNQEEQLLNVSLDQKELEARCAKLVKYFGAQAAKARGRSLGVNEFVEELDWKQELSWLYEQLLRPVAADLHDVTHVHVVTPLGPLRYLPFEALIRESSSRPAYAIQSHSFSYWPDMQFSSFDNNSGDLIDMQQALVIGDPDGSLDGAKKEAIKVHATLDSQIPLLLGSQAKAKSFREQSRKSSHLHIATHGKLNGLQPEKSYLVFSDRQITVPELLVMKFDNSPLAVLSACETGLNANGLECATLARAFAHAGAPNVVATLWQVNDDASESLMTHFYSGLSETPGQPATALAEAKREMITSRDQSLRAPWMWAGYVLFGKK